MYLGHSWFVFWMSQSFENCVNVKRLILWRLISSLSWSRRQSEHDFDSVFPLSPKVHSAFKQRLSLNLGRSVLSLITSVGVWRRKRFKSEKYITASSRLSKVSWWFCFGLRPDATLTLGSLHSGQTSQVQLLRTELQAAQLPGGA